MIQKWARAGVKTNAITAASQTNGGVVFNINKNDNLQPHELIEAKSIYIIGTNLAQDHPVISHLVQNMRYNNQIPVTYITKDAGCFYTHRADETIYVKDYHAFIKAINLYLLKSEKAFGIFLNGLALYFNEYKEALLKENYAQLIEKAGVNVATIEKIAESFIAVPETAIIVSEKTLDEPAFKELKNTMLLTEKQGKMFSGMMILKTACNSQGLYDMGINPEYGPGFRKMEGDYLELLKKVWKTDDIPPHYSQSVPKNLFIFGENVTAHRTPHTAFLCVQSLFENETTAVADLVLPMNFAIETGGSFTSSFKVAQHFNAIIPCKFDWNDYQFYALMQEAFGISTVNTPEAIFLEMISLLQPGCCAERRHRFEV
jgi:predicted molibdopterin-dependent oxidoreductase YjgC